MAAKDSEHTAGVAEEETNNAQDIADLEKQNAAEQQAARSGAQQGVAEARSSWTSAQSDEIRNADEQASEEISGAAGDIASEHQTANQTAKAEVDKGNEAAERERQKGEQQAARERAKG